MTCRWRRCLEFALACLGCCLAVVPLTSAEPPAAGLAPIHPGRARALVICTTCHVFPEPSLLPRPIWKEFVLKKMSFYTGVLQLDVEKNDEGDLYKASGLFPSKAMLTQEEFQQIEDYYLSTSPPERLDQGVRPPISVGLKGFVLAPPRFRRNPPLTTMVSIDAAEKAIYAADATDQSLWVLDSSGAPREKVEVGNIPVWMKKSGNSLYLACIGHFFPKEERRGQLIRLERQGTNWVREVMASSLPRPCHVELADLNGDRKPDVLLSMFGYLTGKFSWYEEVTAGTPREHVVFGKAGPLVSMVQDFDGDGHPDIAMLCGQELENLVIHFNDGKGNFPRTREVFRRPPSFGHTYFETADFNRDGRMDLVVGNGDNGDYESPPKPYHGVRIYLAKGGGEFTEACFIPIHGVFRVLARDFDEDGDVDLAVVSFYPDYDNSPRESFVYLENKGDLKFEASTFRECIAGRWMVMDAGDVDGDGDIDIVLGSMIRMPSKAPDFVRNAWESTGPSIMILRNTLREPARQGGADAAGPTAIP